VSRKIWQPCPRGEIKHLPLVTLPPGVHSMYVWQTFMTQAWIRLRSHSGTPCWHSKLQRPSSVSVWSSVTRFVYRIGEKIGVFLKNQCYDQFFA
jgi:hypothetical protein